LNKEVFPAGKVGIFSPKILQFPGKMVNENGKRKPKERKAGGTLHGAKATPPW